jgi:predicted DNA-binding transcriptional regulator AlpA
MNDEIDYDRIIDRHELRKLVPLHPRTLQRLEDVGFFPVRLQLGQSRIGWSLQEVVAWIEWRKTARFDDVDGAGQSNAAASP